MGNLLARTLSRASFAEALGEEAFVHAMLEFEGALAQSQAEAGVIPASAAKSIAAACRQVQLSPGKLAADGKLAASLAIPFAKALTEAVRVAHRSETFMPVAADAPH